MEDRCFFYRARVVDVYDGDTVTVDVDLGFSMSLRKLKVRLSGIDAAEMRGGTNESRARAVLARDWLRSQILGKEIYLESKGIDKYGRWLGRIHTQDGNCCNDQLLVMGLAIQYSGGSRAATI
jgi:micrococcal nuclease